jgi:hypothetical protein
MQKLQTPAYIAGVFICHYRFGQSQLFSFSTFWTVIKSRTVTKT